MDMENQLESLPRRAREKKKENQKYFQKLKKRTPKDLDSTMQEIHDEVFEHTDCLACANCCKTTSPMFNDKDIERISKYLRMKVADFQNQYLRKDSDDFIVLKESPCPFLFGDNTCMVYDVRPKACSEYPHTNRRKFIQLANLTIANTEICPATYEIVERLKQVVPMQDGNRKNYMPNQLPKKKRR